MLKTLTRLLAAASLITGVLAVPQAHAQAYPSKPITFVVPFAAGSATDQLARALGQSITAEQAGRRGRQQGRRQRHARSAAGGHGRRTATRC